MRLVQLMRQADRPFLFIRLRMAAMSALTLFTVASIEARAQTDASYAVPVVVQAEEGVLGDDFAVFEDGDVDYVSVQTDLLASSNPGSSDRIASYEVAFPASGTYDLFARIRVGPGTFNDDSFFYGNDFGEKAPELESDWRTVNNIQTAGFIDPNAGPRILDQGIGRGDDATIGQSGRDRVADPGNGNGHRRPNR